MASQQVVVHRNGVFWWLLVVFSAIAACLFGYTLVQQNLPHSDGAGPVQLLDIQSATAALVASSGALLARAQYAMTVRPMIGFMGRAKRGIGASPGDVVWASQILNGAQDAATIFNVQYAVTFGPAEPVIWVDMGKAVEALADQGVRPHLDYNLLSIGPGFPMGADLVGVPRWGDLPGFGGRRGGWGS